MNAFLPDTMSWIDFLIRILAATVLPLALGIERFTRKKPLDFRPYVIVSITACGLMIGSMELLHSITDPQGKLDPTRVIGGVITGIGFLGAGAMFREGKYVQGAGSAAVIWCAGGIGLLCGMGEVWLAVTITVIVLGLLIVSAPFTDSWDPDSQED
jgi:putative Mg2+ transporter-C (MgtC) family protein